MNYQFVFSTRKLANNSTFTRWKIDKTENTVNITGSYSLKGLCVGMTLSWIKVSMLSRRLLTAPSELGSEHLMGIRSSQFNSFAMQQMGYWVRWDYTFSIYGLSRGGTRLTFFRPNKTTLKMHADWMLSKKGHFLCILDKDNEDKTHCFGMRAGDVAFEFFDPNQGLFRFRNALELKDFFPEYMERYNSYIPGSIRFIEVVREP